MVLSDRALMTSSNNLVAQSEKKQQINLSPVTGVPPAIAQQGQLKLTTGWLKLDCYLMVSCDGEALRSIQGFRSNTYSSAILLQQKHLYLISALLYTLNLINRIKTRLNMLCCVNHFLLMEQDKQINKVSFQFCCVPQF